VEKILFNRNGSKIRSYGLSLGIVILVWIIGLSVHNVIGYRGVAFIFLVGVSIAAMFLDMLPVLTAAALSALLWDFFFIPPRFTLTVGTGEDRLLLLMYFVIALINAALTMKIRQMEKAMKERDEKSRSLRFYNTLLNSLSHELRTPITTILGCTDNLQSNSAQLSQLNNELVNEISVASVRLNQQVENLLNMSRLESGVLKVKKDWCDINDLVYKTIHRLEANLSGYRLSVQIPEQFPLFRLDFGLMEQVLYNLLLNVTQHTPSDTLLTVQAFDDRNALVLIIADNGHGFPSDEMEKVFDKFHRIKGASPGGTGLGLSIVKGFVEAHGGTVVLENLPLRGAKFTIKIPCEKATINKAKHD
jgi:two-component system, OmpR family, sensor histidine kinase KdpD